MINSIYSKNISSSAKMLDFAIIYENAIIMDNVIIGEHNVIGKIPTPTSEIKKKLDLSALMTLINENTRLCSNVTVYSNVTVGKNCLLGDNVSLFTDVTIGDNTIIGRSVTINSETIIGCNSRIMDGSHVAGRSKIGDYVFISTGVFMANDNLFGKNGFTEDNKGPHIEDFVSIGVGVVLLPNIRIGRGSIIAAGSVVKKDIPPGVLASGNPANVICPIPKYWDRRP